MIISKFYRGVEFVPIQLRIMAFLMLVFIKIALHYSCSVNLDLVFIHHLHAPPQTRTVPSTYGILISCHSPSLTNLYLTTDSRALELWISFYHLNCSWGCCMWIFPPPALGEIQKDQHQRDITERVRERECKKSVTKRASRRVG
jgi:hypothetical protein